MSPSARAIKGVGPFFRFSLKLAASFSLCVACRDKRSYAQIDERRRLSSPEGERLERRLRRRKRSSLAGSPNGAKRIGCRTHTNTPAKGEEEEEELVQISATKVAKFLKNVRVKHSQIELAELTLGKKMRQFGAYSPLSRYAAITHFIPRGMI